MDKLSWKRASIDLVFVAGALVAVAVLMAPTGVRSPAPPPPAQTEINTAPPPPPPPQPITVVRPPEVQVKRPPRPTRDPFLRPVRRDPLSVRDPIFVNDPPPRPRENLPVPGKMAVPHPQSIPQKPTAGGMTVRP